MVSGSGEISSGGTTALLRANSVVYVGPREAHRLRNTGSEKLRVVISTPLLVRSDRALGYGTKDESSQAHRPMKDEGRRTKDEGRTTSATEKSPQVAASPEEPQADSRHLAESAPAVEPIVRPVGPAPDDGGEEALRPDISSLMRRGSNIAPGPQARARAATCSRAGARAG